MTASRSHWEPLGSWFLLFWPIMALHFCPDQTMLFCLICVNPDRPLAATPAPHRILLTCICYFPFSLPFFPWLGRRRLKR
ncbi:hypothetical protein J3E69DRAFT_325882 [Trichoderma sp. SZMC 28015]